MHLNTINPVTAICLSLLLVGLGATVTDAGVYPVTTTSDSVDGSCDSHCSLRDAIIAANGSGDLFNLIPLPSGTFRLILVGPPEDSGYSGDLDVTCNLAITGQGVASTIIDAKGLGERIFDVHATGILILSDMTIQGGRAGGKGGGARVSQGSLTLHSVNVTGNSCTEGGGGVGMTHGQLTIDEGSRIFENSSDIDAGGVYSFSGILSVADTMISDNHAVENAGGLGIYYTDADIRSSTFSGNTATTGVGGGLHISNAPNPVNVENCTIADNSSANGSAMRAWNSVVYLKSVTISNNNTGFTSDVEHYEGAMLSLTNTLIDGDCGGFGILTSYGGNIESPGSTCQLGLGGKTVPNLKLGTLRDNSGLTETILPNAGSPALAYGTAGYCLDTDQRGYDRDKTGCDSGAVERAVIMADDFESGGEEAWK